ncbi:GntR family transcriptional regulator [Paenibacillus eucommiae]|uniref:DNA-binding GntR family transcriptional regulator n=1 Tax=Paenibacillus eucommiae TaxID=1355755 RepID=A0ABS4ISX6_9BACL|nr:GntR family transcriptional regulator [Paenibacillus eucommiae]MBP1990650.1 DNA-binding GntR family transcriptional regulator [Paenibacillus eucommiae]
MKAKTSLKDEIRSKIITEITAGNFSVDSVLTEKKLIEMFNVSKSPVREALVELCNEKVLESMPRYGYRIVQLDAKSILDAIEVRQLLELSAFEKTIPHLNEEKIDILRRHNEEHDRSRISVDVWTHWNYNNKFHLLLISFADNPLMYEMLEKILGMLSRAYAQYYWNRWKTIISSMDIESHSSILKALEQKDYALAAEKLKADILFVGEQLRIK